MLRRHLAASRDFSFLLSELLLNAEGKGQFLKGQSSSHTPGQDIPGTPDRGAARPSRRADAAPTCGPAHAASALSQQPCLHVCLCSELPPSSCTRVARTRALCAGAWNTDLPTHQLAMPATWPWVTGGLERGPRDGEGSVRRLWPLAQEAVSEAQEAVSEALENELKNCFQVLFLDKMHLGNGKPRTGP